MNHRIRLPVIRLIINGKPFEELFFAFKDRFQSGNSQRFTKAAGTREKIHLFGRSYQLPDVFSFVHIQEITLNQIFKIVNAAGNIFHCYMLLNE